MELYDGKGNSFALEEVKGVVKSAPWDTVIHRGWVNGAKENTIPAIYLVKENGYDWAECDVRFSSDGVAVLAHDTTVTSEDGATTLTIAESTLAELQAITLSTHERFGAIKVPAVKEVLNMARLYDIGLVLDIKSGATEENMHSLAADVVGSGWAKKVIYMPNGATFASAIQSVDRNASFDFVINPTATTDLAPYQALLTGANTVGFDMYTNADGSVDMDIVNTLRSAGLNVSFWSINENNYIACMDACPLRITKSNTADAVDLDAMYLADQAFW